MADAKKGAPSPVGTITQDLPANPATDRLKKEATAFAVAQAERLLISTGRRLGEATARLQDVAEGNSPGLMKVAAAGGRKLAEGKGPLRAAVEVGAGQAKNRVKDALKGSLKGGFKGALEKLGGTRKGGGGKGKFVTIVEDTDVGVPVRDAYDQWTQFQEFSTFAKGVQGVESSDDTTSNWRAKIFWSSRSWRADTTEQIPDERIAWTSEGAKGTVKGVVTFHPLGENLTKVLLVLEYHPKGLFEKTGNIWRAQARRARLDLKHFHRFVMMRGEASGSWRGEIRDGSVVRSHEEALEAEREEETEAPADSESEGEAEDADEAQDADEAETEDSDADRDEDQVEDESDEEEDDEDAYMDEEEAEADYVEDEDAADTEPEVEHAR